MEGECGIAPQGVGVRVEIPLEWANANVRPLFCNGWTQWHSDDEVVWYGNTLCS